jgi:hypothetical protein
MYAINVCARICLNTEGLAGKHVYIMSDSQHALRALKSYTFTSNLVAECFDNLKRLTTKCNLTLMWVQGHMDVDGNEETGQLWSETHFIGPEPFFGYSSIKYKTNLNEWIEQGKKDHFSEGSIKSDPKTYFKDDYLKKIRIGFPSGLNLEIKLHRQLRTSVNFLQNSYKDLITMTNGFLQNPVLQTPI